LDVLENKYVQFSMRQRGIRKRNSTNETSVIVERYESSIFFFVIHFFLESGGKLDMRSIQGIKKKKLMSQSPWKVITGT